MKEDRNSKSPLFPAIAAGLVCLAVGFYLGMTFRDFSGNGRAQGGQQAQAPADAAAPHAVDDAPVEMLMKVKKEPGNAQAWAELGHFYFDHDMPAKAVDAYARALAIDPSSPDIWTDQGIMYKALGQFQKALDCFGKAAALDPKHEQARYNRGVVLMHDLNDMPGALAAWEEVLRINPQAAPMGRPLADMVAELRKMQTQSK